MSIEARNVSKRFNDFQALTDVSVHIEPGRLTALLGPSGGGKSTLLRIIAGLETPDSGTIHIDGTDTTYVPARHRGIGFVFQHYAPFTHMTVWDNVAFGLKVAHAPKDRIRERVGELLDLVGLAGLAKRYPSQISGGQRQRMALARALAVEPRLLLLDEPFGALDVKIRQQLRAWLRDLHDQLHATTVFVTHDQEEAMELADEIVVINGGRVEQSGTPGDLYDRPANDFVMSFLGPTTRLGGTLTRPHDIEILHDRTDGAHEGMVERTVDLGFQNRVDVTLTDGTTATVQVTRAEAQQLDITPGDVVFLRSLGPGSRGEDAPVLASVAKEPGPAAGA
ncbi:sulfate ABC transporter ATP-binding protein [Streptomyces sp. NPDC047028]|uniref:sulfate/molybdate ABC transporter ATP-binding protein n=1 Tax=Streptomyces sp. NPDC047028 TaxID=3155793 RepID=UPI0033D0D121